METNYLIIIVIFLFAVNMFTTIYLYWLTSKDIDHTMTLCQYYTDSRYEVLLNRIRKNNNDNHE